MDVPQPRSTASSFELPSSVCDWLGRGDNAWFWLPSELSPRDEAHAREQLAAWDALAGRLLREALFGDGESRRIRKDAEAVAAVAEQLAVRLAPRP